MAVVMTPGKNRIVVRASGGGGGGGSSPFTSMEIPLLAGVGTATSSTNVRVSAREIDISGLPLTYGGKSLTVKLNATLEVSLSAPGTSAVLSLNDITLPFVAVASISTSSPTPTHAVSTAIPLADSSGCLWVMTPHMYELDLQLFGTSSAICSAAWLSLEYI